MRALHTEEYNSLKWYAAVYGLWNAGIGDYPTFKPIYAPHSISNLNLVTPEYRDGLVVYRITQKGIAYLAELDKPTAETFHYNDGGRANAGYKGDAGDCSVRAIAIATGKPYQEVYDTLGTLAKAEPITRKTPKRYTTARDGVYKRTLERYMASIGWMWIPTMKIGSGCKVHLKANELPKGNLVVQVSKHLTAVIDGVINDTYDPSREGTRCVYGYWIKEGNS